MEAWHKLNWDRPSQTDESRVGHRHPLQVREAQALAAAVGRPVLRITDFVSQYAIGDNLTISSELLLRSQRLLFESRVKIAVGRMRLLCSQSHRPIQ